MNCRGFQDRFDAYLEDRLYAEVRREAQAHLDGCAGCRDLVRLARLDLDGSDDLDLTAAILEQTAGSSCAAAHERLCAFVDGELEALDTSLVGGHVDGCADCAGLQRTLISMAKALPQLAELDPGEAFTAGVLAATAPTSSAAAARQQVAAHASKLTEAFYRLLQRPRIAWEGAYLGAMVLTVLFVLPGSPLVSASTEAIDLVRTNPLSQLRAEGDAATGTPATAGNVEVPTRVETLWRATGLHIFASARMAAVDAYTTISADLGTLLRSDASVEESGADETSPETNDTGEPR